MGGWLQLYLLALEQVCILKLIQVRASCVLGPARGVTDAAPQLPGLMEAEQKLGLSGSNTVTDVKSMGSRERVGESCLEWRGRDWSKDLGGLRTSRGDSEGKTSRRSRWRLGGGHVGWGRLSERLCGWSRGAGGEW